MKVKSMPLGSVIHNIELVPGRGAKLVRSAGLSAQLMAKSGGYVTLKMPSGEIRMVNENCKATFGVISNPEWNLRSEGKAGRMRWRGVRPTVRGTAMNPVDHPHGGGEGKTSGGRHPVNPSGKPEGRTRRPKKASQQFIVRRRPANKARGGK
jgi:large subunit ribosomal protein L2